MGDAGFVGIGNGGGSGGSDGGTVACPATVPTEGASCSSYEQTCEYGTDQNLSCNTHALCDPQAQGWTVVVPTASASCPTSAPGVGGCPSSRAGITVGQACGTTALDCAYPEGRCACSTPSGPVLGGGGAQPVWTCETPGAGCPEPRPRLGAACTSTNTGCTTDSDCPGGQAGACQRDQCQVLCDYGACKLPGGLTLQCSGGEWTTTPTACAL